MLLSIIPNFFSQLVTVPFGWILSQLYKLLDSYGLAMIIFAVIVQLVLLPITAKSKKGMMKMSRLQPRVQELQKKYANDQAKLNAEIQALYKSENASMTGGCLWSLVPMLILLPLYQVVKSPEVYLGTIDFNFIGLDLGSIPQWRFWTDSWAWNWATIGLFLIPVLTAVSQLIQTLISQKLNNSVITNEKGVQDKEVAEKSQANSSMKMMMWMMPLMSMFIGFSVPAGLSIYWLVGGICRTIEDVLLTRHYRKIYDAEDAARLEKAVAQEALEAEKERIRAARRAANPDGITSNTSKKKLQQKQREEQQAAKAAAAKEYAVKKGLPVEEEKKPQSLSGIASRPYCKGRAYQADRYTSNTTEE